MFPNYCIKKKDFENCTPPFDYKKYYEQQCPISKWNNTGEKAACLEMCKEAHNSCISQSPMTADNIPDPPLDLNMFNIHAGTECKGKHLLGLQLGLRQFSYPVCQEDGDSQQSKQKEEIKPVENAAYYPNLGYALSM